MSYTKGKWHIWHTNNLGDIVQTEDRQIATVVQGSYFDKAAQAESAANAHLIAAAPDLLAACKKLIEWDDSHDDAVLISEACSMARAAMGKTMTETRNKMTFSCGCRLDGYTLTYCPMHEAAEAMYEALKGLTIDECETCMGTGLMRDTDMDACPDCGGVGRLITSVYPCDVEQALAQVEKQP